MRLLLIEDAVDLVHALTDAFRRQGFVVESCADGLSGLELASSQPYALVILDRALPGRDGIAVCRELRARGVVTPILLLTARDAVADRVEGLDAGADDYLVKPFAFAELLARARALTRRTGAARTNVLTAGDLSLDLETGRVTRAAGTGSVEVALSAKELVLLTVLLRRPGRLFTAAQLLEQAWPTDAVATTDVVRAHIKNLRKKLVVDGRPGPIETVHGVGYRVAP